VGAPPASATCRRPTGHESPGRVEDRLRHGRPDPRDLYRLGVKELLPQMRQEHGPNGYSRHETSTRRSRFGPSSDAVRKDMSARQEVAASRPSIVRRAHTAGHGSVGPATIVTKMVCAPLNRVGGQLSAHRPPRARIRAGGSTPDQSPVGSSPGCSNCASRNSRSATVNRRTPSTSVTTGRRRPITAPRHRGQRGIPAAGANVQLSTRTHLRHLKGTQSK
jgi:hypothetical protein